MASGKYLNYTYSDDYMALHARVNRDRGPASSQICVDCGRPAHDWSQLHATDGTDIIDHYDPRCRSCHRYYDSVRPTHERIYCRHGHAYAEVGSYINKEGVRICRQCDRDKAARRRLVSVS